MVYILLCSAVIVLALSVCVAASQRATKVFTATCASIAAIGSFLIYGYSYSVLFESAILASIKTIIAVIRSFAGANSLADVMSVPLFGHNFFQIIYWTIQLLCIFSTTSVALTTFGSNLLQNLRIRLNKNKDLYIIYSLNENTLRFAEDILKDTTKSVVFVDAAPSAELSISAKRSGAGVKSDAEAIGGSVHFLKSVGMCNTKRKLHVFALNTDNVADQIFARKLCASLERLHIDPAQTAITVLGDEDDTENQLFYTKETYGYGNVYSVNKPYLTSRLLLQCAPTYKAIQFDSTGKAVSDFHGLLIGCDRVGQAVLRQIVMNTQFEGSNFKLAVFAPNIEEIIGRVAFENAQMFKEYDIKFFPNDGRSKRFYEYVDNNISQINYIVLCTGNKERNMEIARQLQPFLIRKGCTLPVYQCDHTGVRYIKGVDCVVERDIYSTDILCSDKIDEMAIALNHTYCGSGTPIENWLKCDYFSRMSSRASADFFDAMIYASGRDAANWELDEELLENLAKTEHKRWCAFHYAMGFSTMPREEWDARAKAYQDEMRNQGFSKIRIGKDIKKRLHACLIDWDPLDELSARETAVTGKPVDYKQMDRNNILTISQLLKSK